MHQEPAHRFRRIALAVVLFMYLLLTLGLLETTSNVLPPTVHVGYPLDDTYIHMAIARHVVEDEVWGITPYVFSSSTSSPLWTAILAAGYALVGVNEWLPVALNVVCGVLVLWVAYTLLKRRMGFFLLGLTLVGLVFLVPLPVLTVTGMEHTLHTFLTLATVYVAADVLAAEEVRSRRLVVLMSLAALTTAARYEGLFLVFAIGVLFGVSGVRKRSRERLLAAVEVSTAGVSPVFLYGLVCVAHGWPLLPPAILIKGQMPRTLSLAEILEPVSHFFDPPYYYGTPFVVLLIVCVLLYGSGLVRKRTSTRIHYLVILFVSISLLHMEFAREGVFFRYEGYLIALGAVIFGDLLALGWARGTFTGRQAVRQGRVRWGRVGQAFLVVLLVFAFLVRTFDAFTLYPKATRNIYQQQYQMGLFLHTYYEGQNVVANDIGAINYLASIKLLDLEGLGSLEMMPLQRAEKLKQETIAEAVRARDADVIVIYGSWYQEKVPDEWVEVGAWQIQNNVICARDTVNFYALTPERAKALIAHLQDFSDRLPPDVLQSGLYTEP